nr:Grx4 family monothiol glutaredoxin [Brevundimonas alba]
MTAFTERPVAVTDQAVANPVHAFIADTVKEHDVVLFMKGTPDAPRCGFSSLAVQILDHVGASFVGVDVLQDEALRDGIKTFSDWPTIPQLYVKGEFVGGSDIVREMFNAGELQTLLTDKGVPLGDADA